MSRAQTTSRTGSKGLSGGFGASQSTRKRGKQAATAKRTETIRLKSKASFTAKGSRSFGWFKPTEEAFVTLYKAPVLTQVEWVKSGVGARDAKGILGRLRVPQGEALTALQIPVATVNRKAKTNAPLSPAEGERVLGVGRLLGQLQTMVRESGNLEGFDASAWLSTWMSAPVPALGGARPLDLMDTMTGQALVSQMLAQMQSGAYA
ncbi:MAG TPA: antitoxin Xre/MbcA/ParS toxin-binding domain-containing protein [Acetobacteraceae bacterium]|nr:antitoxin Xre/MbcA/ParS toxin-binding domain-containing protein [Acetobacteraceae bacterium]